jgi:GNAT superfamily N-acetyltransferase
VSNYRVEPLAGHDRRAFTCGSDVLDRYFREQVTQDIRRRVAACFVAIDPDEAVAGFYTLAATAIALDALPPERARRLPRYPVIPAVLLGRLGVSTAHQGRQLGAALVADALLRSMRSDIVGHVLVVDAKDDAAERFYAHLEFTPLPGTPNRLIRVL